MGQKYQQLNMEILGLTLLRIPAITALANHKYPKSTLSHDVLQGEEALEAQFVKDLFTLTNDEIVEKWFGSKLNALHILNK